MKNTTNVSQNTLKTYYKIVEAWADLLNEGYQCYLPFLDYCYDIATCEFEDNQENHAAIEYKSPEAQAIIAAAERFEKVVQEQLEEDKWNALFELCHEKAPK